MFCGLAAAAVVIVAAAAAVVAAAQAVAVVAAAAEQQDQNDDPPAATVTPGTVVTHSHYLQQGFVTAFAVHSMLFPRPKKVHAPITRVCWFPGRGRRSVPHRPCSADRRR